MHETLELKQKVTEKLENMDSRQIVDSRTPTPAASKSTDVTSSFEVFMKYAAAGKNVSHTRNYQFNYVP